MRNLNKQHKLITQAAALNILDNIIIKQINVNDYSGIQLYFKHIYDHDNIDILINNVGMGFIRSIEQTATDEINYITNTNYLSVVNCTKAVISKMRQNKSGHIINISSVGELVGQPFNELYCATKFAIEGFTKAMASYMTKYFNINFTLIEPGGITSEFANNVYQNIADNGGIYDDEYKPILNKYIDNNKTRRATDTNIYQTPLEVANVILQDVINVKVIPLRIRTSLWAEEFCAIKTNLDKNGLTLNHQVTEQFLA